MAEGDNNDRYRSKAVVMIMLLPGLQSSPGGDDDDEKKEEEATSPYKIKYYYIIPFLDCPGI